MAFNNLGGKVSTSQLSIADIVQRLWGSEFTAPDHAVYVFGGNRKFDSTDRGRTGIYGVEVDNGIEIQSEASDRYPDMYHGSVLTEDLDKIDRTV